MKKILTLVFVSLLLGNVCLASDDVLSSKDLNKQGIVANSSIKKSELDRAKKIILN